MTGGMEKGRAEIFVGFDVKGGGTGGVLGLQGTDMLITRR